MQSAWNTVSQSRPSNEFWLEQLRFATLQYPDEFLRCEEWWKAWCEEHQECLVADLVVCRLTGVFTKMSQLQLSMNMLCNY